MLKHYLYFILVSILVLPISAQTIGGENAWWKYDFISLAVYGEASITYANDTIIDQTHTDVYERWRTSVYNDLSDTVDFFQGYLFIQNLENGLVKYSTTGTDFDTLYHFNLEVGDSYFWYERIFNTDNSFRVTVVDYFDYEEDDGTLNTAQIIELDFGGPLIDTIYSGFGSKVFYLLPYDLLFESSHEDNGHPVCYQSPSGSIEAFPPVLQSRSPYLHDCESTSSSNINLPASPPSVTIFPNPSRDRFIIRPGDNELNGMTAVQLVSMVTGQIVAERQLFFSAGQDVVFDLDKVAPGAYYIRTNSRMLGTMIVVP